MKFSGSPAESRYAVTRPVQRESREYTLWLHQLRTALRHLCASDFPRGVPLEQATDAGFRVVLQQLYESHFQEFVSSHAWQPAGLSQAAGEALYVLQQRLDAYDEPDTDAAIVADPAWWAVLGQAILVVRLLG